MKLALVVLTLFFCLNSYSQQCDTYLLLKEGSTLEYTNYDRKGKALTVGNHYASKVTENGGAYTSDINLSLKDLKKRRPVFYGVSGGLRKWHFIYRYVAIFR